MKDFYKNLLSVFMQKDNIYILIFFATMSILPLVIAYIMQYAYGIEPCKLCLYERIAFFSTAIISIAFLMPVIKHYSIVALGLISVTLAVNVALSFYHIGVENNWFHTSLCSIDQDLSSHTSLEKFFLGDQTTIGECSEVKFRFLKISLAGWNLVYCLILFIMANYFLIKNFAKFFFKKVN